MVSFPNKAFEALVTLGRRRARRSLLDQARCCVLKGRRVGTSASELRPWSLVATLVALPPWPTRCRPSPLLPGSCFELLARKDQVRLPDSGRFQAWESRPQLGLVGHSMKWYGGLLVLLV